VRGNLELGIPRVIGYSSPPGQMFNGNVLELLMGACFVAIVHNGRCEGESSFQQRHKYEGQPDQPLVRSGVVRVEGTR